MMQLMPAYGAAEAKKSGLPYSFEGLTRDPAMNIRIGDAMYSRLMTTYNGSLSAGDCRRLQCRTGQCEQVAAPAGATAPARSTGSTGSSGCLSPKPVPMSPT